MNENDNAAQTVSTKEDNGKYVSRRLFIGLLIIVILCICLCIASLALAFSTITYMRDNSFTTGEIDIEIEQKNNITVVENIAPGMSFDKTFTVVNNSPVDIYYKVYFENIGGRLDETVRLTVKEVLDDGTTALYEGLAKDFTADNATIRIGEALSAASSRDIVITFTFPELAGDEYQNEQLTFDISVTAVQAKNNPEKKFD